MRDEPKLEYGDDWDFQEFLEVLELTFLVDLDPVEASRCETLGEFEHYVYDHMVNMSLSSGWEDRVVENTLRSINHSLKLDESLDEISKDDFGMKVSDIVRGRWRESWVEKYQCIRWELGNHIPKLKYASWARAVLWGYGMIALVLSVLSVAYWGWPGLIGVLGLLLVLAHLFSKLPHRAVAEERTLGEAVEKLIQSTERVRLELSFPEVCLRIRRTYAGWSGGRDPEEVSAEDTFPYLRE